MEYGLIKGAEDSLTLSHALALGIRILLMGIGIIYYLINLF